MAGDFSPEKPEQEPAGGQQAQGVVADGQRDAQS